MKATASIFHDTRREKMNSKYPVKILIYFNRNRKYYRTRFEFTKEEYNKLFTDKPRDPYKSNKKELDSLITKAEDIIEKLGSYFTFEQFHNRYILNRKDKGNVLSMYDDLIKKLEADEQFGTATTYKNALSSFKAYIKKDNLNIEDINVEFLKRYEKWMEQPKTYITKTGKLIGRDGNSRTSIGIYVRTLRRMFNIAIKEGIVSEGAYPFGRDKYIIPSGRKAKRSLKLNEVAKLYNYEPKGLYGSHYLFAKDMWVFSYLANGINMKDLAFLKYRSMSSETIVFFREKTKNTNKDNEIQIKVDLNDKLREIIKRWGNKNTHPENYIFPIVTHSMSSKEKHAAVKQAIKNVNKYLKKIGKELQIELNITTYVARHTHAGVLKNSGASVEFISESLGHADIATTKNYLNDLEDEKRKEMKKALTSFLNFVK